MEVTKEPKVITMGEELNMRREAEDAIERMVSLHGEAREIDLLNAYLTAFLERNERADRERV